MALSGKPLNEHPGYAVVEDTRYFPGKTTYIPVRLAHGLAVGGKDDKGRHLSGCIVTDYPCGTAELFHDENNQWLWFDNEPHAVNFLNKWVRVEVGYNDAWAAWDKHLAEEQEKHDRDIFKERHDLVARLRKQEAAYKHLGAVYEAAAELIRIYNEGGISREHLGQVVKLVLKEPESEEVERIYRDVTESLGLE